MLCQAVQPASRRVLRPVLIRSHLVSSGQRGNPPPRPGCELDILIDGAEALPKITEALADARSEVNIAGWHITPDFSLSRDDGARRLRNLLGELAERRRSAHAAGSTVKEGSEHVLPEPGEPHSTGSISVNRPRFTP